MSLRFRKRITLLPGVRMNLSGSGVSWTVGPRGLSLNVGKQGTYLNAGVPGTGLFSRTRVSGSGESGYTGSGPGAASTPVSPPPPTEMTVHTGIEDDGTISYHDDDGHPVDDAVVRRLKAQKGAELREMIKAHADAITASVQALTTLYLGTPDPRQKPAFTPTPFDEAEPAAPAPKPVGLVASLLPWERHAIERQNAQAEAQAKAQDDAWVQRKALHDGKDAHRRQFLEHDIYTDPAAMESYLEERLHALAWPQEAKVAYEVGKFDDGGHALALDLEVPDIEQIPAKTATVAATGYRILFHPLSASELTALHAKLVYGIVFRTLGEAFAALPAVSQVTLSAFALRADHATANTRHDCLVSVRVLRAQWEEINFAALDKLDVEAALARFDLRRKVGGDGRFEAIDAL